MVGEWVKETPSVLHRPSAHKEVSEMENGVKVARRLQGAQPETTSLPTSKKDSLMTSDEGVESYDLWQDLRKQQLQWSNC